MTVRRSLHEFKKEGLSRQLQVKCLAEQLAKITHFTVEECKALIYLHSRLESAGPLDRLRFKEILHTIFEITDNVMLDLAFNAFDKDCDTYVDDIEFVRGLSTMLRGTSDELIEWCYFIYDLNGDGGIARDELAHCLKGCIVPGYGGVGADDVEDGERDIMEIAMRKLDVDRDGQITLADFKKAVKHDPLLIVAVGPCLPPVRCSAALLALITEKFRSYTGANLRLRNNLGRKTRNSITAVNFGGGKKSLGLQSFSVTNTVSSTFGGPAPPPTSVMSNMSIQSRQSTQSVPPEIQSVSSVVHELMNPELTEQYVKRAKQLSISIVGTLPKHLRKNSAH